MTIDGYLLALRRLLPRYARLRALPEIREHLRDAAARQGAAGVSPAEAEVAATAEFGAIEEVARRLRAELAVRETRFAAVLAVGAVAFFVFPLYVIPENSLPPAPWQEKPGEIALLQHVSLGLWILGGGLAAVSAGLAWTRWPRPAALALASAAVVMTGAVATLAAVMARWLAFTPATPNWALAAPFALASLAVCVGAALWARASRQRLCASGWEGS